MRLAVRREQMGHDCLFSPDIRIPVFSSRTSCGDMRWAAEMSAAPKWNLVSVEEYLASELDSPIKPEYVCGVIYAKTGTRNAHNIAKLRESVKSEDGLLFRYSLLIQRHEVEFHKLPKELSGAALTNCFSDLARYRSQEELLNSAMIEWRLQAGE